MTHPMLAKGPGRCQHRHCVHGALEFDGATKLRASTTCLEPSCPADCRQARPSASFRRALELVRLSSTRSSPGASGSTTSSSSPADRP